MDRLWIIYSLLAALATFDAGAGGGATAAEESVAAATESPLPFSMPVPDGWRTETIPFPLGFAPDLPYRGLEELRFSPGMFVEGSPEFWSYTFVWWVEDDDPTETAALDAHLESYFRGLAAAVAPAREIDLADAVFSTSLVSIGEGEFSGRAETPDAFVTGGQVRLNVRGSVVDCLDQGRRAAIFSLSPQEPTHPVWRHLDAVRTGFRCRAPIAVSTPISGTGDEAR